MEIITKDGTDMKETYLVSGHPRSGTSMMMHGLIKGGLDGAFSSPITQPVDAAYMPNPNGFYELVNGEQMTAWFPWKFQGKVLKSIYGMLPQLAPGNYKVVFMLRDPAEIRKSMLKLRKRPQENALSDEDYYAKMGRYLSIVELRPDMEAISVWYHDVIANPEEQFERIRDFGIPIDPQSSASVVNPRLYRNKNET